MKTNKTSKYSKRLIILVILLNVIFAGIMLFVLWDTGSDSPSLTMAWFGFTTTELLAIAGIKVNKTKTQTQTYTTNHFTDEISNTIDSRLRSDANETIISDEEC